MSDLSSTAGPCVSAATAPVNTPARCDSIYAVLFSLCSEKGNNDVHLGSSIVVSHQVAVWIKITSIEGCNMLLVKPEGGVVLPNKPILPLVHHHSSSSTVSGHELFKSVPFFNKTVSKTKAALVEHDKM